MKRKPIMEQIGAFIEGRGFYMVLTLCMAALGISAYYLYSSLNPSYDVAVAAPTQVVLTATPVKPTLPPTAQPTPTPKTSTAPTPTASPEPGPTATPTVAEAEMPTQPVFTWPVSGDIIADYSLEVLAYDETMEDWRVHSGVDIAAALGTQVQAISAGTVTAVEQEDFMGTTVLITHADGLTSYYANLAETPTVAVGDTVSGGTVIGAVGDTAVVEQNRASHLHFELRQDGLAIDPERVLPAH